MIGRHQKTTTVKGRGSAAFVLAATGLVVAACGGGGGTTTIVPSSLDTTTVAPETTMVTTTIEQTTTTIPGPVMPLTGLRGPDEATATRPAVVAKIDNHPAARPQSGLIEADIVYEENVESLTRFAAVLHSQDSEPVGPLRSGRSQDVELLKNLNNPIFLWSGGNPTVTKLINNSTMINASPFIGSIAGAFFRASDKGSPHNLYSNTPEIRSLTADKGAGTPVPLFTYRAADAAVGGTDSIGVKLSMDGDTNVAWQWDAASGTYLRFHGQKKHNAPSGNQVNTNNVVVLFVKYRTSSFEARSPEAQTVGSGVAWVFMQGKYIVGTWNRPDSSSGWGLLDETGAPIDLTPGRTWVELTRDNKAAAVPAGATLADVAWP
ncbi:MAG: DUF3048 domain-containing protein [Ilumatobacteraceae bacterium]